MLDSPVRPLGFPPLPAVAPEVVAELARLLHPDLIEVRGCVLLPWAYEPENFETWWSELKGDHGRIEAVLNHVHLWDVFEADVDDGRLRELAEVIAASWRATVRLCYPNRRFEIGVFQDGEDYGPTVYLRSDQSVAAPASAA